MVQVYLWHSAFLWGGPNWRGPPHRKAPGSHTFDGVAGDADQSSEHGTYKTVTARIWWPPESRQALPTISPSLFQLLACESVNSCSLPLLSREYGTYKTIKARIWPWLRGKVDNKNQVVAFSLGSAAWVCGAYGARLRT